MDSKLNPYILAAPCLAASATLFFLGTGLAPLWLCTWLAAIPVLWLAPRVSSGHAFFLGTAAYAIGGLNEWSYSRQVLPTWLVACLLLMGACLFGLAVLLFRQQIMRGRIWRAVLIFPAFWVFIEYLVSVISIHGTFGNIAYSQMNFLPIVQIASVTGIWGISFCLFLFAATVAGVCSSGPKASKLPVAISSFLFLASVLIYGEWRLRATASDSPTLKVALMGSSATGNFFAATPEELHVILKRYAEQMNALSGQHVQLIVLPEHTGPVTDASESAADALIGQIARDTGAYIAIGVQRIGATLSRNQERIYSPNGD